MRDLLRIVPVMTTDIEQPYVYRRHELVEPDWTRFPGYRGVTREQWEDAIRGLGTKA